MEAVGIAITFSFLLGFLNNIIIGMLTKHNWLVLLLNFMLMIPCSVAVIVASLFFINPSVGFFGAMYMIGQAFFIIFVVFMFYSIGNIGTSVLRWVWRSNKNGSKEVETGNQVPGL